eukprot:SAG31_NODE_25851_length_452_cov_26.702550_1_plen_69_part_10
MVCTGEFELLVAKWSEGDHSDHLPLNGFSCPGNGALLKVLSWSLEHGKRKQAELIGMTTVRVVAPHKSA